MSSYNFGKKYLTLIAFFCIIVSFKLTAITVDSSYGFDSNYPASKTIDGIYGDNNMAQILGNAWVIYDLGVSPQTIRKFRITPPRYGGNPPVTFNPRSGTIEFSNDKITWTAAIFWTMPALESILRTDFAEVALPVPVQTRYVRLTLSAWSRIGEIFFIESPQLAAWEMAQNTTYSNSYPAIRTCDGYPATFAASVNSEGSIIYDQGSSKYFCGFAMTSRNSSTSYNPTSGSVYVSDDPAAATWTLVGSWTLPGLINGNKGIVSFTTSQAQSKRYIKLVNNSGGSQWAEFELLFPIVIANEAKTAIIIPDGITIANPDTFAYSDRPVLFAAKELRYHVNKATQVTLGIYNESQKPSNFTNFIYLGNCQAASNAGISSSSLINSQCISRCIDGNLYIAGEDSDGATLNATHYLTGNNTHAGTLLGVYDFLANQLGVRWIWPGVSGEYVPSLTDIAIAPYNKTCTPKFISSRFRDSVAYSGSSTAWTSQTNCNAFMDNQQLWLRRHGFVQNISMDYGHSFTNYWARFSLSNPDYFNLLPDSTRRADPYHSAGNPVNMSMCLSNTNLYAQKITDWLNTRTSYKPWVQAAENDTPIKCTCANCMALDAQDPNMSQQDWDNRLQNATTAFSNEESTWQTHLGSMSDRLAKYLLAVQAQTGYSDPDHSTVVAYAYENYTRAPISTQLNDRILIGYVPNLMFPWSQDEMVSDTNGWKSKGARVYLRPNFMFSGHNYPIFFADKFGIDFTSMCMNGTGIFATDFDGLTGQYGAQALNLYMVARMNTSVGVLTENEIREEFYATFGPATNQIRDYFDYLKYISDNITGSSSFGSYGRDKYSDFPAPVRSAMRTKMNSAIAAAAGNSASTAKVSFLDSGLTHAEKSLVTAEAWADWNANCTDPDSTNGFNAKIADLDTFRAATETSGISNLHYLRFLEDMWWNPVNRNATANFKILPYRYNVNGGLLFSLKDDIIVPTVGLADHFVVGSSATGNELWLVLDCGGLTSLDKIAFINRLDVASNYNIRDVNIYVATDESSFDFNKYNPACYNQSVFSGRLNPDSNFSGIERFANISNCQKRYLLIKVISNFWGTITEDQSQEGTRSYIMGHDVSVVIY